MVKSLVVTLQEALRAEHPYSERYLLQGGRAAAVLVLIGVHRDCPGEPCVLITRRTDSVGSHKGQMAFPGGMSEADEAAAGDAGAVLTALRETEEEVGIPGVAVEAIGALPPMTTVTDFRVTPIVGVLRDPIDAHPLRPNPGEIAEAFWVSISRLREPGVYVSELMRYGAVDYPIHVYQVNGHRIWGATGAMLKNLLDRLQRSLGQF